MGVSRVSRFSRVVIIVLGSIALSVPAVASEWAQSDYNAAHSRANLDEAILKPSNVANLRFDLAIGLPPRRDDIFVCEPDFVPDPAVTANRLYTAYGADLAAFNTTNGRRLWRVPLERPGRRELAHTIIVRDGRVYVGMSDCESQSDPVMVLIAFDAATGHQLWSSGAFVGFPGFSSVVATGSYLVVSGSTGGGGGEQLFVVNAATGAFVWQYEQTLRCEQNALVVRRAVILRDCGDEDAIPPTLKGLRIGDGSVLWSRTGAWSAERGDDPGPAGRLLLAIDPAGRLTALTPRGGQIRWAKDVDGGSLAVDSDRVYASCNGELCALSREDGSLLWSRATPAGELAVAGKVLYLGSGEMFRARTGTRLGRVWNDEHDLVGVAGGKVVALGGIRAIDLYALPPG
jgi:outer membrane protein assembly factor BamB